VAINAKNTAAAAWVMARDGRTAALLLLDGPAKTEPCPDSACTRRIWTMAAIVDPSGEGRFDHGLQPRLERLLLTPAPTGRLPREPLSVLVLPPVTP
jgi:hypothetical protein